MKTKLLREYDGHGKGCQCGACQQRRLQQYYATGGSGFGKALVIVVGIVVGLFVVRVGSMLDAVSACASFRAARLSGSC
jgi:hypothetical protein